jgi:hypothetical protein
LQESKERQRKAKKGNEKQSKENKPKVDAHIRGGDMVLAL